MTSFQQAVAMKGRSGELKTATTGDQAERAFFQFRGGRSELETRRR